MRAPDAHPAPARSAFAGTVPLIVARPAMAAAPASPRRILVLKLDHFGDFVMGLPALRQLRAAATGDHLCLVCGPWLRDEAERSGLFDEIRTLGFFPPNGMDWTGAPCCSQQEATSCLAGAWDIAVDLRVDADTRPLLGLADARLRCGIGGAGEFAFLDLRLPRGVRGETSLPVGLLGPDRFTTSLSWRDPFTLESDFSLTDRYITEGPDVALPAGRLRASFALSLHGPTGGLGASVMIEAMREGRTLLARKVLKRRRQWGLHGAAVLTFDNPAPGARHQLRVHTGGRAPLCRLRFGGVAVETPDAPAIRPRQDTAALHVGEQLSLLAALVIARALPPARPPPPPDGPVVIAPFGNSDLRNWPPAHYAALIETLCAEGGRPIWITGTQAQRDSVQALIDGGTRPELLTNLAGRTQWAQMPDLLRHAGLVICNNSGVAHLAASVGARVLALHSGSHLPGEWGPCGAYATTIVADVPCAPCGLDRLAECGFGHACMRGMSPRQVAAVALEILAGGAPGLSPADAARSPDR